MVVFKVMHEFGFDLFPNPHKLVIFQTPYTTSSPFGGLWGAPRGTPISCQNARIKLCVCA